MMGMYTELVLKCEIRDDVPDEVESVLRYLFRAEHKEEPEKLPDHKFFTLDRWSVIGRGCSFYHTPFALSDYRQPNEEHGKEESTPKDYIGGYIFSRSDIKDYGNEIANFLDWVDEYIEEDSGFCIGWTWYEEKECPTLIFKK